MKTLKTKGLTSINEVLSMSVTQKSDIIDKLSLVSVYKIKSLS